jgi:hypothetical protein
MYLKALETGILLHSGPIGGPERGRCLPGTLRERQDFDLSGDLVY